MNISLLTMKFYAVRQGRSPGIYRSWAEAEVQVKGFPNAIYKCFIMESEAHQFLAGVARVSPPAIYIPAKSAEKKHECKFVGAGDDTPAIERYRTLKQDQNILYIYTDGSTSKNGSIHATGGYGVFYSDPSIPSISKKLLAGGQITNNICELQAIVSALTPNIVCPNREIVLYTDSEYAMLALTERYPKWEKNGWVTCYKGKTTPIKNRELIQKAYRKVQQFHVQIRWIASHTDNTSIHYLGNAIADKLSRI